MTSTDRREFLRLAGAATATGVAVSAMPASIRKAFAMPARQVTGTIKDVQHIVILMQENRSFDHYFGTMRGVRGFGDPHPVPLESGAPVWAQSDGQKVIPPFHLDTKTTNALLVPGTPHSFADSQAAWNQGKFGEWPRYKNPFSMGYYRRDDIPFQFALAEAFTLCDAYHCSVTSGTDPNRIVFWSGSNFDPQVRARGQNCTDINSEPNNLRCWIKGALPEPGYTYAGNDLTWATIPDVLEKAGVSWRFYQDPNDNWTGAMHGGLAFESFRKARPGSPLYEKGMSHYSLEQLARDVADGTLPQVSWVLPPKEWSEHPSASTPLQGAEFTAKVLEALTSNPDVWSKTVFFQTFDENDGLFDHAPPPSPPSYDRDGKLCGAASFELAGHYFHDDKGKYTAKTDTISGAVRPWALGPRVPMYVVSPWSRGGWVTSEVFDHTSVGQFLEKRFDIVVPAISPWHRAVCGDLTSAFDFETPNNPAFPKLPDVKGSFSEVLTNHAHKRRINPPDTAQPLFQEPGSRPSRALPYQLHVDAQALAAPAQVALTFRNTGAVGAVFHVYDRLHLDRIPRRYTVEAGKSVQDIWSAATDQGAYDLWIYGPNGFVREFKGRLAAAGARPEVEVGYLPEARKLRIAVRNSGSAPASLTLRQNRYAGGDPVQLAVPARGRVVREWDVSANGDWYDLAVTGEGFERRFAGRLETGKHGISDPGVGA
jgi:phospholipase C